MTDIKNNLMGAIVLGMHDALVSQTGIIAGLTFSLANRYIIIMTAIISAVAAGLSMAASNYLAQKTSKNNHAVTIGTVTGLAYLCTSFLLIIPFFVVGTLWIFYFPHSGLQSPLKPGFNGLYFDIWKNNINANQP